MSSGGEEDTAPQRDATVLLLSVFLVSVCALIYELLAGAVSSYLTGNSVTQFSIVIGLFLSAMGAGSYLTQFLRKDLLETFLFIEVLIGLIGGSAALILFLSFAFQQVIMPALVFVSTSVGALIGMEIPIIMRLLREKQESLRLTVANVMAVDYIGALAASLAFPFFLAPYLGLMRTSFLFGLMNVGVAWLALWYFRDQIRAGMPLAIFAGCASLMLMLGVIYSNDLVSFAESNVYADEIIYAKDTPYQRIVITRWKDDIRLYLNGQLQFSTIDEYRYHEALVHPAMEAAAAPRRVLVLGGGDGMAVREILKHRDLETVTLVDLDPQITRLFRERELLTAINGGALHDPRVTIINRDAMIFLEESRELWDVIIMDLPDPSDLSLGKLYSRSFFALAGRRLSRGGVLVAQSTSPYFAREAFWCIVNTIDASPVPSADGERDFFTLPYHVNVPSFGEWGFTMAAKHPLDISKATINVQTRFLDQKIFENGLYFPRDMERIKTEINRLDNQKLVEYYRMGFEAFYE